MSPSPTFLTQTLILPVTHLVALGALFLAHLKNEYLIIHRLLIFLASPEGQEPVALADVAAFMPSPQFLIEIDRNPFFQ